MVSQKYEAEDILRLLKEGRSFIALAAKYSLCSSKNVGGDLSDLPDNRLDNDFKEAASTLKVGQISHPIRTRFGYHIIERLK